MTGGWYNGTQNSPRSYGRAQPSEGPPIHPAEDGTRYVLEDSLHVVAIDSAETFEPEPRCFGGGILINWRSINNEPQPKKKSSFLPIEDHYMLLEGTPRCVVGELAEKVDFETYGSARDSTRDHIAGRHRRVVELRERGIRDELPTNQKRDGLSTNQKRSSSAQKDYLFQLDKIETAEANSATPAEIEDRVQVDYLSSNLKISEERIRQEVAHELQGHSKNKSTRAAATIMRHLDRFRMRSGFESSRLYKDRDKAGSGR